MTISSAPGAQKLDARLVSDLHPPTRQQSHPALQIRQFGPLLKVELRALRTELVIESVNLGVVALANVAMLLLLQLSGRRLLPDRLRLKPRGRKHIRSVKHRLLAQLPDAGLGQHGLVSLLPLGLALAFPVLDEASPNPHIRAVNLPRRLQQSRSLLD